MSRKNGAKLELKQNLSPPSRVEPPRRSRSSTASPPSSCVSSEQEEYSTASPEEAMTSSMMLVGCPRCLMYVMLSEDDPKCPKCKSTVLLDVNSSAAAAATNCRPR